LAVQRYVDRNIASVPALAADALRREMDRLGGMAIGGVWARTGLLTGDPNRPDDAAGHLMLSRAMLDFVTGVNRRSMSDSTAQALATLLRVQRYYDTCHELSADIASGKDAVAGLSTTPLHAPVLALARQADSLLVQLNPANEPFAPLSGEQSDTFEHDYQALKALLLAAGASGEIDINTMESLMRSFSTLRRVIDQAGKAARLLDQLRGSAL
jgi:phosphate:Na+ symporter